MNRKTGCFLGALAILALGVFIFWRAKTPPQVGENFARLSPAQQQERRADAQKLQSDVENLVSAARNNESKTFAVTASEAQLNTLLQDNLRIQNLPIRDLRIGLAPHELALQGQVSYKGFNSVVTLRGDVVAEKAKLKYELSALQIGGLPAPSSLRRKAEKAISEILNKHLAQTPGTITRVEIADKTLTIEGSTH